ncbi:MAG: 50S ribosomal protein L17 [Clostridia bacterium]|jgi:large subunit ribosomal protein L17|nr:50S ribosomal protein L17 [Clostridia bacterium]MDD3862583.1 50S ribosomal protein L17 [Clostridia bacterium]
MANSKLGLPTKERIALIRNQVSHLFWYGKIETTKARAKSVQSKAEKLLTLAINSYDDTVTVTKMIKGAGDVKSDREVINDGPKKLAARRAIMSYLYDLQEQRKEKESKALFKSRTEGINHPLIEKIFNVYAPKYAERIKEIGIGGGYTRIINLDKRRGDNAERVIIELI